MIRNEIVAGRLENKIRDMFGLDGLEVRLVHHMSAKMFLNGVPISQEWDGNTYAVFEIGDERCIFIQRALYNKGGTAVYTRVKRAGRDLNPRPTA